MQFKVPQFLEIEDKIFGPFTFKEFVYLAGGAGLCYILLKMLGFAVGVIPAVIVAGLALLLTFYRPNGKPFVEILGAAGRYTLQSRLYVWQSPKVKGKKSVISALPVEGERKNAESEGRLIRSKLADLAWSLDVMDLKKE